MNFCCIHVCSSHTHYTGSVYLSLLTRCISSLALISMVICDYIFNINGELCKWRLELLPQLVPANFHWIRRYNKIHANDNVEHRGLGAWLT